jgi:hypothetical protein
MQKSTLYLIFFFSSISNLLMAQTILVTDNFVNRSKFLDNTLNTIFGANSTATTGFNLTTKTDGSSLTYNALTLTLDAQANSGYVANNSLKTLTSIDYPLNETIDRTLNNIIVEFDGIWDAQSSSGENGRLVVTLMDALPAGGGQPGQVNDTSLADPFGKPIYNIRIRNNTGASSNGPLMLYGAGTVPAPGWEKYSATGVSWWLPGFSVQAGGGSPGSGPNYPALYLENFSRKNGIIPKE